MLGKSKLDNHSLFKSKNRQFLTKTTISSLIVDLMANILELTYLALEICDKP